MHTLYSVLPRLSFNLDDDSRILNKNQSIQRSIQPRPPTHIATVRSSSHCVICSNCLKIDAWLRTATTLNPCADTGGFYAVNLDERLKQKVDIWRAEDGLIHTVSARTKLQGVVSNSLRSEQVLGGGFQATLFLCYVFASRMSVPSITEFSFCHN